MQHVLGLADKANGAVYASLAGRCPYPPEFIYGAAFQVRRHATRCRFAFGMTTHLARMRTLAFRAAAPTRGRWL